MAPISPQQAQKIETWLRAHFRGCKNCGGNGVSIGDIVAAPSIANGGMTIGGASYPMVQVLCNSCAYMHLFAAVPLGVP
jgi:hypothetical protein